MSPALGVERILLPRELPALEDEGDIGARIAVEVIGAADQCASGVLLPQVGAPVSVEVELRADELAGALGPALK